MIQGKPRCPQCGEDTCDRIELSGSRLYLLVAGALLLSALVSWGLFSILDIMGNVPQSLRLILNLPIIFGPIAAISAFVHYRHEIRWRCARCHADFRYERAEA